MPMIRRFASAVFRMTEVCLPSGSEIAGFRKFFQQISCITHKVFIAVEVCTHCQKASRYQRVSELQKRVSELSRSAR